MAFIQFDARSITPAKGPELIPAGKYPAIVVESDIAPTKSGGQQLKLTLQIIEGPYSGRKVFGRINVQNSNAQAEQIGQAELSALCHAAGVMQLQDTTQLHNRPIQIRVAVRKDATGQYEDQNEVKGYAPHVGAVLPGAIPAAAARPPAGPPAAFTPPPAATPNGAPPWARNAA